MIHMKTQNLRETLNFYGKHLKLIGDARGMFWTNNASMSIELVSSSVGLNNWYYIGSIKGKCKKYKYNAIVLGITGEKAIRCEMRNLAAS